MDVFPDVADDEGSMMDKGYHGVQKDYPSKIIYQPYKARRNHPLTQEQKAYNRHLWRRRIVVEHPLAQLNPFQVLAQMFRHARHKRACPHGAEHRPPPHRTGAAQELRRRRLKPRKAAHRDSSAVTRPLAITENSSDYITHVTRSGCGIMTAHVFLAPLYTFVQLGSNYQQCAQLVERIPRKAALRLRGSGPETAARSHTTLRPRNMSILFPRQANLVLSLPAFL